MKKQQPKRKKSRFMSVGEILHEKKYSLEELAKKIAIIAFFLAFAYPTHALTVTQTVTVKSPHAKTTRLSTKREQPSPSKPVRALKAVHTAAPSTAGVANKPFSVVGLHDASSYVIEEARKRFGEDNVVAFVELIRGESHFNPLAINPTSGACGIFQAYPCMKMPCELSDVPCQTKWGLDYLERRYGSPNEAQNFKLANGWY